MKKIAIYNIKGGDGKSTTARTISVGLSKMSKRVLLFDADGQGNTSKTFIDQKTIHDDNVYDGLDSKACESKFVEKFLHQNHGHTISELFMDPKQITNIIHRTSYDNLDIVPSDLTLFLTDTELRLSNGARENKLKRSLNFIKSTYDYAVIDCSPVKSLVSVNVLYTEPLVIIPVSPFDDSMQGLALTINEINEMKNLYEELDIDYRILIVKNRINNECRANCNEIRSAFKDKVFKTVIRDRSKPIEKAAQNRKTVLDIEETNVANDYRELIKEIEVLFNDRCN